MDMYHDLCTYCSLMKYGHHSTTLYTYQDSLNSCIKISIKWRNNKNVNPFNGSRIICKEDEMEISDKIQLLQSYHMSKRLYIENTLNIIVSKHLIVDFISKEHNFISLHKLDSSKCFHCAEDIKVEVNGKTRYSYGMDLSDDRYTNLKYSYPVIYSCKNCKWRIKSNDMINTTEFGDRFRFHNGRLCLYTIYGSERTPVCNIYTFIIDKECNHCNMKNNLVQRCNDIVSLKMFNCSNKFNVMKNILINDEIYDKLYTLLCT